MFRVKPNRTRPEGPASDFLDVLAEQGDHLPVTLPSGLWPRLMRSWPMQEYARLAVVKLLDQNVTVESAILEVGAGVGNATALIADDVGEGYVRTDLHPALMPPGAPGRRLKWDFDEEPPPSLEPGSFDVAFGVNSLHCASDIPSSLGRIVRLLRPGGLLLLAEGEPVTKKDIPWALNAPFGMLDGWWDRGGFKPRDLWIRHLSRYGAVFYRRLEEDGHDLGGLLWIRVNDPLRSAVWP